jgi:aromatic-amino-acid transaminase
MDPRPDKIDVGVGVYRDGAGNTPILRAVSSRSCCGRASRAELHRRPGDKRYTGCRGIVLGRHPMTTALPDFPPGGAAALVSS